MKPDHHPFTHAHPQRYKMKCNTYMIMKESSSVYTELYIVNIRFLDTCVDLFVNVYSKISPE